MIETSRSMQRRAEGTLRSVQELLGSGLSGQLEPGDTLGLWTFSDQLGTSRFPLQRWSAEAQTNITRRVLAFLQAQKYEKSAMLDRILPAVQRVVANSEYITVILVSSGAEDIHGTPFDDPLNQSYKRWRSQQQSARMPFITALRAQGGKMVDYSITPAPWPAELPALPAELRLARAAAKELAAARQKPPSPPPLIISGKKPTPAPAVKLPDTAGTNPQSMLAQMPGQATTSQPVPPAPATAPAASERSLPAPQPKTESSAVQPFSSPPTAPLVPTESKSTSRQIEASSPESKPATQPVAMQPGPASPASLPATAPKPSPITAVPIAKTTPPAPDPPDVTHLTQSPTNAAAAAAQVAAAAPRQGLFSNKIVWLAGPAGLLLVSLLWVWRVRSRPTTRISLITRSLDRKD